MIIREKTKIAKYSGGPKISREQYQLGDEDDEDDVAEKVARHRCVERCLQSEFAFAFLAERIAIGHRRHGRAGAGCGDENCRDRTAVDPAFVETDQEGNAEERRHEKRDRNRQRHRHRCRQSRYRADNNSNQHTQKDHP
jgi:hypothetical protein